MNDNDVVVDFEVLKRAVRYERERNDEIHDNRRRGIKEDRKSSIMMTLAMNRAVKDFFDSIVFEDEEKEKEIRKLGARELDI